MDDAVSIMLRDVRPRGALFDRSLVDPPWSLRFDDGAPLTLVTMLRGHGWITPPAGAPLAVGAGDVALLLGPDPFVVGDRPDTPARGVVGDDGVRPVAGTAIAEPPGPYRGAGGGAGGAVVLSGSYQVRGSVCERVLQSLPTALVVPAGPVPHPVTALVATELAHGGLGQQAVLDRLLDLLLVTTLRDWFDRPESGAPAWYRAQTDQVVGTALRLVHDDPAHPWTVAGLARAAGVSRAAFARRFADLVGEPPMSYVTCWRMCVAADLLRQTDATVDAVARRVGYASAYALSAAFTRVHGVRPSRYRAAARAPAGSAA